MIFANAELVFSIGHVDIYKSEPSMFMPFASTSYYWLCQAMILEFHGPFKSIAECIGNFELSMAVSNKAYTPLDLNNIIFIDFKKRRRIK